MEVTLK